MKQICREKATRQSYTISSTQLLSQVLTPCRSAPFSHPTPVRSTASRPGRWKFEEHRLHRRKLLHTDMKIETQRHNLYAAHVSTVFTRSRSTPVHSTFVLCPPAVAQLSRPRQHLRPLAGIAFWALNVTLISKATCFLTLGQGKLRDKWVDYRLGDEELKVDLE